MLNTSVASTHRAQLAPRPYANGSRSWACNASRAMENATKDDMIAEARARDFDPTGEVMQ
jgi:hypothetical protein